MIGIPAAPVTDDCDDFDTCGSNLPHCNCTAHPSPSHFRWLAVGIILALLLILSGRAFATPVYEQNYNGNTIQEFDNYNQVTEWYDVYICDYAPYVPACVINIGVAEPLMRQMIAGCTAWNEVDEIDRCITLDENYEDLGQCSLPYYDWHAVQGVLHLFSCQRCGAIRSAGSYWTVRVDSHICTLLY